MAMVVVGMATVSVMATAAAAPSTTAEKESVAGNNDPQSIDKLPAETKAIMRRQEALQPAVAALSEESIRSPRSGFAGIAFEGQGLTLYWKGPLSHGMAKTLKGLTALPVGVRSAPFSRWDLQRDGAKIRAAMDTTGGIQEIQGIGYRYDGRSLEVVKRPRASIFAPPARRLAGRNRFVSAEQIIKRARLRVPVHVSTAKTPTRFEATRLADSAPWNGGGRWETWRGNRFREACTTGFGVRRNSRTWILTAAHCASSGDGAFQGKFMAGPGTSFTYMGGINTDQWAYDLLLIDAGGYDVIFDGDATTSRTKDVNDWGYWAANELVCQSGATSGTVCGIKELWSQDLRMDRDSDGDCCYWVLGLIRSVKTDGAIAVRPGDSGGPVFTLMGSGVRAKGITSAGSYEDFYFQDWADVIRLFNAYPNT
jgi:hypothetical protein